MELKDKLLSTRELIEQEVNDEIYASVINEEIYASVIQPQMRASIITPEMVEQKREEVKQIKYTQNQANNALKLIKRYVP